MNDPGSNLEESLKKNLLVIRIVTGALIAGVVTLLAIVLFIRQTNPQPPRQPVVGLVGVVFAAVALVVAAIVPGFIRRSWERQVAGGMWPAVPQRGGAAPLPPTPVEKVSPDDETNRWWGLYLTTHIVRCAILEGAAFLQGVAYLVEGNLFSLALGIGLLIVLAMQWPRREPIDRWVEARREAVEQIRAGQVP